MGGLSARAAPSTRTATTGTPARSTTATPTPDARPRPAPCDDDDACTLDQCDDTGGCTTAPVVCDDGDACTVDVCDAQAGSTATPVGGLPGVLCALDASGLCPGDTVPLRVIRRLELARRQVEKAIAAGESELAHRRVSTAVRTLAGIRDDVARAAARAQITPVCGNEVLAFAANARARMVALLAN